MHKLANIIKNDLQEHIVIVCEPGACCFTHLSLQDGRAGVGKLLTHHGPHNLGIIASGQQKQSLYTKKFYLLYISLQISA